MSLQSLENKCIQSLQDQIESKKITLKKLKENLSDVMFDKLLDQITEKYRTQYTQTTFKFLKGELLVKTAKNVCVDEDMILLYDPDSDSSDREYVRNIYINPKYDGDVNIGNYDDEYDTIEFREYIDDDWKYIMPFVTEYL